MQELRYGENPHQRGARYREIGTHSWWDDVVQHSGMELSYLNLYDASAAWDLAHDLGDAPTVAIIKHANPCGVAVAADLAIAYQRAYECDERSAFGGIVAFNRPIDMATAERMIAAAQADVVIAPGYADGVIDALTRQAQEHPLARGAGPAGAIDRHPPDQRRVPGAGSAPLRVVTRRLAGGHEGGAHRRPMA